MTRYSPFISSRVSPGRCRTIDSSSATVVPRRHSRTHTHKHTAYLLCNIYTQVALVLCLLFAPALCLSRVFLPFFHSHWCADVRFRPFVSHRLRPGVSTRRLIPARRGVRRAHNNVTPSSRGSLRALLVYFLTLDPFESFAVNPFQGAS